MVVIRIELALAEQYGLKDLTRVEVDSRTRVLGIRTGTPAIGAEVS